MELNVDEKIMHKVGKVLIIAGLVDIFIWSAASYFKLFYGSPINVFGLIAGWFLLKNSRRAVRITNATIEVLIGMVIIALPGIFYLMPYDLLLLFWAKNPVVFWLNIIPGLAATIVLCWSYVELRKLKEGLRIRYIISGLFMTLILVYLYGFLQRSPNAKSALEMAKAQNPGDKVWVKSVSNDMSSGQVRIKVKVIAYNDQGYKELEFNQGM